MRSSTLYVCTTHQEEKREEEIYSHIVLTLLSENKRKLVMTKKLPKALDALKIQIKMRNLRIFKGSFFEKLPWKSSNHHFQAAFEPLFALKWQDFQFFDFSVGKFKIL